MEISLLLGEQILSLFLMAMVGYGIVKKGLLKASDSRVLSVMIVYIFSPCVIINAFQIVFTKSKMAGLGLGFAAALAIQLLFTLVIWLAGKKINILPVEKASIIYTNAGYLTVPLVLGVMGEEWVFYTSAYVAVFNILMWTHGILIICKDGDMSIKKILLNPNIIACLLGIVLFIGQIKIPEIAANTISGFAKMVGPASMLAIGMIIGNMDLKSSFRNKRIYLACFVRLIILPFLVIVAIRISGIAYLHPDGKEIMRIVMFAASAPAATAITQIAQIYDQDVKYAGLINAMTVIFCVITMPLIILLYEVLV